MSIINWAAKGLIIQKCRGQIFQNPEMLFPYMHVSEIPLMFCQRVLHGIHAAVNSPTGSHSC